MRRVLLIMTASIDGFVVAPKGHAGMMPEPAELKRGGGGVPQEAISTDRTYHFVHG